LNTPKVYHLGSRLKNYIVHISICYKTKSNSKKVSEQLGSEDQRKEINLVDYPEQAALVQLLKDVEFQADITNITGLAPQAIREDNERMNELQKPRNIEDRNYESVD